MILDGIVINRTETARNIFISFDYDLNMQKHINESEKTRFCDLKWIWSVRKYMSTDTANTIVHALIISGLDYCNTLLNSHPLQTIKQLQSVMNAAARLVTLNPRDQRAMAALKTNIQLIVPYVASRKLRYTDQFQLLGPKCNLKYGVRSFSVGAPKLWNGLSVHIKGAVTFQCLTKKV